MLQVDIRNPSTAKRGRTDGGRREDDWTCPGCGNVNFSFRTTCNMRNCTQPRPADHNAKPAMKPMQPPQPYSSATPYGPGHGAPPSSMYLGMPPYGSSMYNGSSMPPYEVPYSGGSAYQYNHGNRMSRGSPYWPVPGPPPPYSGGSMMGIGGMYGMPPPIMDRYGMSMPPMAPPPPMGPRPGYYPDDKSQKKDGTSDNDWTCPKCGNVNFSFRIVCNMRKCGTPKPGSQVAKPDKNSRQKMPEGSWKCDQCGNLNYPFRTKCNRQNCGADKPSEDTKSPSPVADGNEQFCSKSMDAVALRSFIPEKYFFPGYPPEIEHELDPDRWEFLNCQLEPPMSDNLLNCDPLSIFYRLFLSSPEQNLTEGLYEKLRDLGYKFDGGYPKVDDCFDVSSLLSQPMTRTAKDVSLVRNAEGGQQVTVSVDEALRGKKFILVCCFCVPCPPMAAYDPRAISNATNELKMRYGPDFLETIIVVHMVTGWADNETAFDHFFGAFPGCLAVPFADQDHRDFICMSLNLHKCQAPTNGILVNNETCEVLISRQLATRFVFRGAAAVPGTDLYRKLDELGEHNLSLELLLGCTSNDCLVRKSGESVQLSELKEKYVGLYLYSRGYLNMDDVVKAHQHGKDKGFEVVVVQNPPFGQDPKLFERSVHRALEIYKISDWIILPFTDSLNRRLWKFFQHPLGHLIIIDPKSKVVDGHGLDVIQAFGVDNTFPFTRDHIIKSRPELLKDLKRDSLQFMEFRDFPVYQLSCEP